MTRVERSIVLAAPPDGVWPALVEAERLARWFGGEIELDARPGGRVVVDDDEGQRWGTVERLEPGRLLTLRLWRRSDILGGDLVGSRVEFALDDSDEGGTLLTVVETRMGPAAAAGSAGAAKARMSAGVGRG